MKNGILLLIVVSIAFCGGVAGAAAEEEIFFKVIVHTSNPITQISKQDLSQLFLKKVKQWKTFNETVLPFDLVEELPLREQFSATVHGREVTSIKAYWQKQIFSGRGVPPEEKKTEEDVLKAVSENPGAVGYISATREIEDYHVKALELVAK